MLWGLLSLGLSLLSFSIANEGKPNPTTASIAGFIFLATTFIIGGIYSAAEKITKELIKRFSTDPS
jgi:hypothetical protein